MGFQYLTAFLAHPPFQYTYILVNKCITIISKATFLFISSDIGFRLNRRSNKMSETIFTGVDTKISGRPRYLTVFVNLLNSGFSGASTINYYMYLQLIQFQYYVQPNMWNLKPTGFRNNLFLNIHNSDTLDNNTKPRNFWNCIFFPLFYTSIKLWPVHWLCFDNHLNTLKIRFLNVFCLSD